MNRLAMAALLLFIAVASSGRVAQGFASFSQGGIEPFRSTPGHPTAAPPPPWRLLPRRNGRFPLSMSAATEPAPAETVSTAAEPPRHYSAVVVGGGPAGLLAAIMLARLRASDAAAAVRRGRPSVVVYDRLRPPPPPDDGAYSADVSRYYLLGLGHRGQRALRALDAWDAVEKASVAVLGRRDWAPGKTREEDGHIRMAEKAVTSRVIARDKLVGVLMRIVEERYGDEVELRYGWQVDPVSFGNKEEVGEDGDGPPVTLRVSRCVPLASPGEGEEGEECSIDGVDDAASAIVTTSFLIGSDGAARTIANAMEANDVAHGRDGPLGRLLGRGSFRVRRYDDDNCRVYKSIPVKLPEHWPRGLNYSARSRDSRAIFEALPSDEEGTYCALLLLRPDDALAAAGCDPGGFRQFLEEEFPQFSQLIGDDVVADVAAKGASSLPGFRYAGPRLHEGGRTVILGDCVHTVKPYYGLGANTALEDVQILSEILSEGSDPSRNLRRAVREFTRRRAADSRALVTLSRGMDRPGRLGTLRFVLPLILDSAFHRLAPRLFAPSMFGMFQLEGIGFRAIQRRKRLDRAMQSLAIIGAVTIVGTALRYFTGAIAKLLGVNDILAGASLVLLLSAVGFARRAARVRGG